MRKVYCAVTLSLFVAGAFAQNVATIDGRSIGKKEFMWFYKKNHSGNGAVYAELEAYLNQYINFKLKVLDAKEMGLDADTAYLSEVRNYELALAAQKRIAKTSPAYQLIMNEYKEAALMFNISEIKIWNKAQNDENQLRNFYEQHKNTYLPATFDEVKGKVITDYQERLEKEWINTLRKKYTVKINQTEVKKLAKL
ncbi:hypothetical protein ABIE26_002458 [Pedobacter africanus]|uniref:Uncharacterized protein n=1 Tax=Pedobacter africanus TaxID=151894 RepID=A0ACC6KXR4_9SPHI|nr:hypothetical protein [Pedobacter africanus]MDR6784153.1 hypothetical protein [Pedobacter africanus]